MIAGDRLTAIESVKPSAVPDTDTTILAVAGFLFVIALIALMAWGIKTFVMPGGRGGAGFLRGRDRRLAVVETASVDARRKLILLRRDDVEHLIMTGGRSTC